jgi:hypothetical protein
MVQDERAEIEKGEEESSRAGGERNTKISPE